MIPMFSFLTTRFAKTPKIKYFRFFSKTFCFQMYQVLVRTTWQDKWSPRFRAKSFCSTTKFFPLSSDKAFLLTSDIFLHNFEHIISPSFKSWTCFNTEAILYFTSPILWNLYMALIWILPCWNIFIRFGENLWRGIGHALPGSIWCLWPC